jgi:predicted AlkP superfamily pyrophosphatase or phosphodiesterase
LARFERIHIEAKKPTTMPLENLCSRYKNGILCALLAVCLGIPSHSQSGQAGTFPLQASRSTGSASARRAKLVLVITVDQFRYDYVERFGALFGAQGFRRLMTQGASFTNANYDYVPTYTAPGHAAIFTGAGPAQNGIVGNTWFDREAGRVRVMVSDTSSRLVTNSGVSGEPGVASPRVLIGATIGDQMRLSNNLQSKVVAVSLKDRAAVLPGGHRPNGAFWFDNQTGSFVTSDYYSKELPAWVKQFNSKQGPDRYFGMKWERALTPDAYKIAQAENTPAQKSSLGARFPYVVNGGEAKPGAKFYAAFELTPFAAEYLADFAKAAIEAESLGSDEFPDLLSVSFSSPDLAGHYYGPDSQEVVDTFVRLDRVVADLLNYLDRRVGLANTIVAVSGDHGVAPVPEHMQLLGFDASRISGRKITDTVSTALKQRFGDGKWVLGFVSEQIYLDHKLIAERKLDVREVEQAAGQAALNVPGVVDFFTRTQIVEGRMPGGAVARRVVNGFNRSRSGDVCLVVKPFSFVAEGNLATTHGSPYNYDTHVPIILFGVGVRPGRYYTECAPTDIAPTLAALLGIEPPPNRIGRVLPALGAK